MEGSLGGPPPFATQHAWPRRAPPVVPTFGNSLPPRYERNKSKGRAHRRGPKAVPSARAIDHPGGRFPADPADPTDTVGPATHTFGFTIGLVGCTRDHCQTSTYG